MTRTYCDICGEEIRKDDIRRRFKIKEYARGLELKWTPLTVHNYCWKDLTRLIRQHRNENGGGAMIILVVGFTIGAMFGFCIAALLGGTDDNEDER